jgi:hypothetical protein
MPPRAKQVVKDTPMLLSDGKQIQTEYDHERKQHMTFATNQLAIVVGSDFSDARPLAATSHQLTQHSRDLLKAVLTIGKYTNDINVPLSRNFWVC